MAISLLANASPADSCLFSNDFERQVFQKYQNGEKVAPLDMLACFYYKQEDFKVIQQKIEETKTLLESKKIRKKNRKKQIKLIYKYVHSTLLKKYVEDAFFKDLFKHGQYNCVTASALYALLMEHYQIDYQIKETPNHVYLIAEPLRSNILLESTNPRNGLQVMSDDYKRKYINYLAANKIISEDEVESESLHNLFEEHHNKDVTIDIYQLAALQYYNKGVFLLKAKKTDAAIKNLEKANLIYPSNGVRFMLNLAIGSSLDEQVQTKSFDGRKFAKFLNLNASNKEVIQYGEQFFNTVAQELMVKHPNPKAYDQFYTEFTNELADSVNRTPYTLSYNYSWGYYATNQTEYVKGLRHLKKAYETNPSNLEIKNIIEHAASKHLFINKDFEATIDSLEYYYEQFPFLKEKNNFKTYHAYCHINGVDKAYGRKEEEIGYKHLVSLERMLQSHKDLRLEERQIEYAYLKAAEFYISKNDEKNGLQMLKRGLQFVPNSQTFNAILKEANRPKTSYNAPFLRMDNTGKQKKARAKKLETGIKAHFAKTWKLKKVEKIDLKLPGTAPTELRIVARKDKSVVFTYNKRKNIKGRWAVRYGSRLLYLIPDKGKNQFELFKIEEFSANRMVLIPYENDRGIPFKLILQPE